MVSSDYRRRSLVLAMLLAPFAVAVIACAPTDPAARVAKARAKYQVRINSWLEKPAPVAEAPAVEDGVDGEEPADLDLEPVLDETGEEIAELVEVAEAEPAATTIIFDLLVLFEGNDPLPGITVEILHQGGSGATKETRRQWIETAGLVKGDTRQVTFELEGWHLEEGDSFGVSLRASIPPEERGEYAEFADAA